MAREYDKLVRDRIPSVIRENGAEPETHTVSGDEYLDRLAEKLVEEAEEYAESRDLEELADVLAVVDAVRDARDVDPGELSRLQARKATERGRFEEGIVLDSVTEPEE